MAPIFVKAIRAYVLVATHPEDVTDSAEVFLLLTPLEEGGLSASSSDSFDLSPIISGEIPSAAMGPGAGDPSPAPPL